jgi:hypothetical protein
MTPCCLVHLQDPWRWRQHFPRNISFWRDLIIPGLTCPWYSSSPQFGWKKDSCAYVASKFAIVEHCWHINTYLSDNAVPRRTAVPLLCTNTVWGWQNWCQPWTLFSTVTRDHSPIVLALPRLSVAYLCDLASISGFTSADNASRSNKSSLAYYHRALYARTKRGTSGRTRPWGLLSL